MNGPPLNAKKAAAGDETDNCPLCWVRWLIWLFRALQPVMLVIQMLVALFLGIGYLGSILVPA
jgi:hypothetical protein